MADSLSCVVVFTVEAAVRDDTALAVINVSSRVNKSVVCELPISPRTVPDVVTAVNVIVDGAVCELLICPGMATVVATAVSVVVDDVVCELLISPGIVTVVPTAVAVVVGVVENISVVIMISVVSLGTFLVDTSGAVVEFSSVPVLVTMVAGCTELDLVGIDDNDDDNSSMG